MQPAPRNLWIPLLIAAVIGGGLLGSMFFPPFLVWAGIMMAMFGAILLGHPRHLLFLYWLWTAFLPLIAQISNNTFVRYANEMLVMALLCTCTFTYIRQRKEQSESAGVLRGATALLGIVIVSFLVNRSPIANAINFLLTYVSFPICFYAAYTLLNRRHWRYLFGAIIGLMLIQFALNIGWRMGVNPLPNIWTGSSNILDMAQGTFASCMWVAYFMIAVIFTLFSALRLNKKHRPWILLLFGIAVIQWYITYTNHSYIFFMLLLPVYLIISKQPMRMLVACVALAGVVVLLFLFLAAKDTYREGGFGARTQVAENFDQKNLERRWDNFVHGPKIELITRIAVRNATKEPFLWLIGNGPGYGLSAVGMERGSAFAWAYLGDFVRATELDFNDRQMNSFTGSFYSGILSIWSELGVAGYILYVGLYIYALRRVIWRLLRKQYTDLFQQVLAEGFVMAMLLLLLSSLTADIFIAKYFTVGLWIWAAMVWDPVAPEGKKTENALRQGSGQGGQRTEDREQKTEGRGLNTDRKHPASVANGWQRPALRR